MTHLSVHHLLARFLFQREAKTTTLDLLARVSVLEGIAGVQAGRWMKNVIPEDEIVQVFGPGVKQTWLSSRESGLLTAVRRSLQPLLKNTTTTADDILQAALIGLGASGGVTRVPLFHGVGKAPGFTVEKVKAGQLGPRDVVGVAKSYARRRAIDVLRAQARRPTVRVDGDEVEPVDRRDVVDATVNVLVDPKHRLHGTMTRSLEGILRTKARPSDLRIFGALVGGARQGKHDAAVARELGLSRAAISQAKARVRAVILEAVRKSPKILEPVLRQHDLEQLSWARRGQRSKMASEVASSSFKISMNANSLCTRGRSRPAMASSPTRPAVSSGRSCP